jgi:hypothetical protein
MAVKSSRTPFSTQPARTILSPRGMLRDQLTTPNGLSARAPKVRLTCRYEEYPATWPIGYGSIMADPPGSIMA